MFVVFSISDVDQAVSIFKELESIDPYRLDNLDTYSNLLYVKELRVELSYLAHRVVMVDKYRVETCCVIGNYYFFYFMYLFICYIDTGNLGLKVPSPYLA